MPYQLLIRVGLRRIKYLYLSPQDIHEKHILVLCTLFKWYEIEKHMHPFEDVACSLLTLKSVVSELSNWEDVRDTSYMTNTAPRTAAHSQHHFSPLFLESFKCE